MTDKTTTNPTIIFHRAKANPEASLARQQAFIDSYLKHLPITTIDYVSGEWFKAEKISELIRRELNKFIIIIQDSLTEDEYTRKYDRYMYFNFLENIGMVDLYLMNSEGKLYEQVKDISSIIDKKEIK